MSISPATASLSMPFPSSLLSTRASRPAATRRRRWRRQARISANFSIFGDVVRKDVEFLRKKISRGMEWASEALHVPQVSKTLDDALWLRHLEDPPGAPPLQPCSLPQPYYPELTGVDLFMADLKALEAYTGYFYYVSKRWSKPLPEVYDPQEVTDYFSCRPHLVALRLLEIFSSFAAAAIKIRTSGTRNLLGSSSDENDGESTSRYNFGIVLKETMLNLGPTFIKVGQSLSTRPDIIGPEISKVLSELHDQIPPFPRPVAMKIIEEELQSPVGSYFSYISEEPVAAASFGQVYRGRTLDGTHVAVKVQRPNLRRVVVRDVYILRLGMGLVQKIAKRKSDLRLYVDELGKGLVGELDYTLEAANASEFMEAHSSFTFMRVPKVYQHLTGKRILTMEWMVGDSPTKLISVSTSKSVGHGSTHSETQKHEAKRRLLDLVSKGVEASLVQLLETGILHADPHPGNLRYTESGQIGFLDFGLLCRMEKKHQYAMLASIVHIVNGDWASLVQSLTEMDVIRPGTSTFRVTMDLEDALGEVEWKDGIPDVKFSRVLGKIWSVALKYHFRMPAYYTLVLRSLASLEGLAIAGDKNFKTFEAAYPYVVRKLLTENSPPMRKILHSVVLSKKKELRWDRLALFLRVGTNRKGLKLAVASNGETSIDYLPKKANGVFDVANLILQLLPSNDGVVLRRLLMTVDGASLIRAMTSKEAASFRNQFCKVVGEVLYQWMAVTLGKGTSMTQYRSRGKSESGLGSEELGPSSTRLSKPINEYISLLKDRRLKVIVLKVLSSLRKDPILTLRFSWVSFVMLVRASALACHRVLISLAEAYIGSVPFAPKLYAIRG